MKKLYFIERTLVLSVYNIMKFYELNKSFLWDYFKKNKEIMLR